MTDDNTSRTLGYTCSACETPVPATGQCPTCLHDCAENGCRLETVLLEGPDAAADIEAFRQRDDLIWYTD